MYIHKAQILTDKKGEIDGKTLTVSYMTSPQLTSYLIVKS